MTAATDNTVARTFGGTNNNVGRVVRILMAVAEMGQTNLAHAIGMDTASLSRALSGKRRWTIDDLEKLSEAFDRPISYFFEPADSLVRNCCFRQEQFTFAA